MYEELPSGQEGQSSADQRHVYTVSRLNREVRDLLEHSFPLLWVEGELSNLAQPSSGHLYFSLKDDSAQVRCAMFRGNNRHLNFKPRDGMQVLLRARLSLYETRGDYQLIAEQMEEAGDGALRRAFEALKKRLAGEGLFDPQHKQPLPAIPQRIGVVTSPSGAAIRDIISVLKRRFPGLPVLVYPVAVQGTGAAAEIAAAIRQAGERQDCDVLIIARGGGSLEDLWAFNEEVVARAIYQCPIPVVSGIGHEIDFTIADFVADVRAPTPSGAAELASPDRNDWLQSLTALAGRLTVSLQRHLKHAQQGLRWLDKRLLQQHPGQRLKQRAQRLDDLEQRLLRGIQARLRHDRLRTDTAEARLQQHRPLTRIQHYATRFKHGEQQLHNSMLHILKQSRRQLIAVNRALETVSPQATLSRGYAIVRDTNGNIVRRAGDVMIGETIETRLGQGFLASTVEEVHD